MIMVNFKPLIDAFKKRAARIEKRFRFAISVLILTGMMLIATFFYFDKGFFFIPILIVSTYFLTYFSLLEGIKKISWFGLFLSPVLLTVFFYLFYFLFPARWLTRLPFIAIYGVSIYATFLCSNIFNVGVERNLQLYRAAFSVNFFYQALTNFLAFNILFSLKQNFIINFIVAGALSFVLSLQLFWTIKLKQAVETDNLLFATLTAIVVGQLALIISFVPLKPTVYALFLTASYYSLAGLIYNYLDQRLFKETIREYLIVWSFVLLITILSISW